jgi:hypothetical protein
MNRINYLNSIFGKNFQRHREKVKISIQKMDAAVTAKGRGRKPGPEFIS